VSDNPSAKDGPMTKQSIPGTAARYAAVVFAVTIGSAAFRLLLHRVLAMPQYEQSWGPIILASVLGLFWFTLASLVLARSGSNAVPSPQWLNPSLTGRRTVLRMMTLALVITCVIAVTAWVGLYLNDEIFESRSLPWIAPLITVQTYGFEKASQILPCQAEGSDAGCEASKWIPTFLMSNSLAYFPFVLIGFLSWQNSDAVRKAARAGAGFFVRWCAVVVTAGLIVLQVMHGLDLNTYDSLYPNPGIGHRHFGIWEQVNDITGTLITVAGLSLPFYLYRAIRGTNGLPEARTRLAEATSLVATLLVTLILGNVY
jgi:hypothetical protein